MGTTQHDNTPLTWSGISWQSEPLPRLELVDPLIMSESELLSYAADLQDHMRQIREVLSVALERIVAKNDELSRKDRIIEGLRIENRFLREQGAA